MSKKSIGTRLVTRYRKNRLLANLLTSTGHSLENKTWIFIIGCYNSGTTLLDQVLSLHPMISGLPVEGVMLTDQLRRPEDFGWRRMWWKCEDDLLVDVANEVSAARRTKRQWSHFYDKKKLFYLEKSISNAARMPFLEEYFKPAHFIHIVRNGYAVAEGIRRKAIPMANNSNSSQGQYPIEMCGTQWVRTLEVVESHRSKLKHFTEIKYEDFTARPDEVLVEICDFLDIPHFDNSFRGQEFTIHGERHRIQNMNERSLQNLSAEDIKQLNLVAGDYLKQHQYFIPE